MKNLLIFFLLFVGFAFIQSCTVIQNSSSDVSRQSKMIADDLYDNPSKSTWVVKKKQKSDYLDFEDEASLMEEERALSNPQPNYLNSRAIYANQNDQGYANGFLSGFMSANPWNSWYSNPYISFGTGFGSRWASPLTSWRLSDPYYFGSMSNMYGPMAYSGFAYQSSFMMNPYFYDPFYRMSAFSNPFNSMYGGMYGSMFAPTNIYNYYGALNPSYSSNYNSNVYNSDPMPSVRRAPREDQMSNRYGGENYNNTPRGNSNSYNSNGANQQRVNSNAAQVDAESVAAPARRNSNYEYRAAPENNSVPQYQNRTESYSSPSSSFGNSSSGSFGSGSSGGGSSSRGPR